MNKKGLTIIELIAILVILGIISSIAIFTISNTIQKANRLSDEATLANVNSAISLYDLNHLDAPIASLSLETDAILQTLVDQGFLSSYPSLKIETSSLEYDEDLEVMRLNVGGELAPLSPLGSTFEEITSGFISLISSFYEDEGRYPRSWGDYRYTDIGLDPEDWDTPILHTIYRPAGDTLIIDLEDGYAFHFDTTAGESMVIPSRYNWNVIYSFLDETWYYHSISEANEINITTLKILIDA